jgi:hypothetical protein
MDYYLKYLKYKNKYLSLRNQMGGSTNLIITEINKKAFDWDIMYILNADIAQKIVAEFERTHNINKIEENLKKGDIIIKVENKLSDSNTVIVKNINVGKELSVNVGGFNKNEITIQQVKDAILGDNVSMSGHKYSDELFYSLNAAIFFKTPRFSKDKCVKPPGSTEYIYNIPSL